jgi:hypothetical protein
VVVLEEDGGRKASRSSSLQKGAWYSLWAQASERRWSSSRKALKGLCGAALSPGPASSGSMALTRSRSCSLLWAPSGGVVTTPRLFESVDALLTAQGAGR